MKLATKITNEQLYSSKVRDIDLSGLKPVMHNGRRYGDFGADGDMEIDLFDGGWVTFSGEHGPADFEEEYGFVLVQEEEHGGN